MREIKLDHHELRALVRFTDPFIHSPEKEEEILSYHQAGQLRPPSLVEHDGHYLVFNGNHRVLVAINRALVITCRILEDLDDVLRIQADGEDESRGLSSVVPLTFHGVIEALLKDAKKWGQQDPDSYSYNDL